MGFAVTAPPALVVPTLIDTDRRSFGDLARPARRLPDRERTGSIPTAELAGGTFTVTNLFMLGARRFAAVVNPPQAAILSRTSSITACAIVREEPWVADCHGALGIGGLRGRMHLPIDLGLIHLFVAGERGADIAAGLAA